MNNIVVAFMLGMVYLSLLFRTNLFESFQSKEITCESGEPEFVDAGASNNTTGATSTTMEDEEDET